MMRTKKQWVRMTMAAVMVWSLTMGTASAATVKSDMPILLDGKPIEAAKSGYLVDDSLFVPYRAIAEQLGAKVGWEDSTRTVSATKDGNTVSFVIDEKASTVNGTKVATEVAAQIIEDSTYVPVRFISETLGLTVGYEEATRTVSLQSSVKPDLNVFGVREGETLHSDKLQISIAAYNHELKDFTKNTEVAAGEGHIHVWLDTDSTDPKVAVKSFDGEPIVFEKLPEGNHTLTVALVHNNHSSLAPEVKKVITFKTAAEPKVYTIETVNFQFSTAELIVEPGSIIKLTNQDTVKHNIEAVDGSFSTPLIGKGETVTFTAPLTPGEYEFVCTPHKRNMKGKLIVK
jgi:plastocyanin